MKRWKMHYPMLRCPSCRRWLIIDGHGNFKLRLATKKQIQEVRGDDSPTPPDRLSCVRTREEAKE